MTQDPAEQHYGPTSGTISGWIGLVATVLLTVGLPFLGLDRATLRFTAGAALAGVLIWSFMLRPRVILREDHTVLLRNPLSTWALPLAGIETVAVGALTRIQLSTGEKYDAVAVGRPVRSLAGRGGNRPTAGDVVAEQLIGQLITGAEQARALGRKPEPGTRSWAVRELTAIAVLALVVLALSL